MLLKYLKKGWKMIDIKNYDKDNVFGKILRKEIPSDPVYETEEIYAFKDINPQAPIHVVIIPKREFCSFDDFSRNSGEKTILEMIRSIAIIADVLKLKNGYRIISNIGDFGGQEVPHFHIHLLGGKKLGRIVAP